MIHLAGALALAIALAAPAQENTGAGEASPLESLVLVLNIISTTHARPVTGVVLQAADPARPALVLVPAQFVSAGDEIIVLDGGTDILRNGRPSRTVARSVETGVAVLEVEGLDRTGVRLSADAWPPVAETRITYAAWPAAADLVEGASLVRRSVTVAPGADASPLLTRPSLPGPSGPLFDSCGHLAAVHLSGDRPITGAASISQVLDSAGLEVAQSPCSGLAQVDVPEHPQQADTSEEPGLSTDISDIAPVAGEVADRLGEEGAPSTSIPAWVLAAALLGLTAGVVYLRRRAAPKGSRILLEAVDDQGRSSMHESRFKPESKGARFERDGHLLKFEQRSGRVVVSDRSLDSERLKLVVAGTPCLPGEIVEVGEGDEMWLGGQRFRLRLELETAAEEGPGDE